MPDPAPAPSLAPSAAAIAATVGGSCASVLVWVLSLYKVFMPAGIESQCGVMFAAAIYYLVERRRKT